MDSQFALVLLMAAVAMTSATMLWRERHRNAELNTKLSVDELTGLPNRRALRKRVRRCQAGGSAWSLLMADVDGFKKVNDRLGHAAGDEVLVHLAGRLARASAAGAGEAFRLHGDEFVVLLPYCASDAVFYAHALAESISWPVQVMQAQIELGLSIGVIGVSRHGTLEQLLDSADAAMYAAKRTGTGVALSGEAARQEPESAGGGRRRRRDAAKLSGAEYASGRSDVYQPIWR